MRPTWPRNSAMPANPLVPYTHCMRESNCVATTLAPSTSSCTLRRVLSICKPMSTDANTAIKAVMIKLT